MFFFFSSRRRHTRSYGDWSSDVCSSDRVAILVKALGVDKGTVALAFQATFGIALPDPDHSVEPLLFLVRTELCVDSGIGRIVLRLHNTVPRAKNTEPIRRKGLRDPLSRAEGDTVAATRPDHLPVALQKYADRSRGRDAMPGCARGETGVLARPLAYRMRQAAHRSGSPQ